MQAAAHVPAGESFVTRRRNGGPYIYPVPTCDLCSVRMPCNYVALAGPYEHCTRHLVTVKCHAVLIALLHGAASYLPASTQNLNWSDLE